MAARFFACSLLVFCIAFSAHAELPKSIDSIIQHVEFLGYSVEKKDKVVTIIKPNSAVINIELYKSGMWIYAWWSTFIPENRSRQNLLEAVNALNAKAVLGRYFLNKNDNLYIDYWMTDTYDKVIFGSILTIFEKESYDVILDPANEIRNFIE